MSSSEHLHELPDPRRRKLLQQAWAFPVWALAAVWRGSADQRLAAALAVWACVRSLTICLKRTSFACARSWPLLVGWSSGSRRCALNVTAGIVSLTAGSPKSRCMRRTARLASAIPTRGGGHNIARVSARPEP